MSVSYNRLWKQLIDKNMKNELEYRVNEKQENSIRLKE